MKFHRLIAYMASALLMAAAVLIAADVAAVQPGGLTVHEWGTFTSVAGEDGSAIDWDALGGKCDLPDFVNYAGYRGVKFGLTGTVRMETPVMYFYSQREVAARVQVQFPHGVITEWYPNGDNEIYESKSLMDQMAVHTHVPFYSEGAIYQTNNLLDPPPAGLGPHVVKLSPSLNGIDTSLAHLMGATSWSDIKVQPGATEAFPVEEGASRYYAARGTDAAPITAGGQHEKFLFYRGVGRFAVPLTARVSGDGKVAVTKPGAEAVPMAMLFENRGGRLGYRAAGAVSGPITLDPPSLDGSLSQLRADLENALVAQGLFRKEAHAMVETWHDSWFEEGSRLIYIVPPHAIDDALPLQVDPQPSQTSRVFVGRIELITPATRRAVEAAMAAGDVSAIDRFGRFLDPILNRMVSENPASAGQIQELRAKVQGSFSTGACK